LLNREVLVNLLLLQRLLVRDLRRVVGEDGVEQYAASNLVPYCTPTGGRWAK
jgi:hypothetical protein